MRQILDKHVHLMHVYGVWPLIARLSTRAARSALKRIPNRHSSIMSGVSAQHRSDRRVRAQPAHTGSMMSTTSHSHSFGEADPPLWH